MSIHGRFATKTARTKTKCNGFGKSKEFRASDLCSLCWAYISVLHYLIKVTVNNTHICWRMFGHIQRSLALIGHFLAPYEAILAPYEGMLAPFEAMLAPCEPILGSCWAYVGPILTYFWPILAQIKNFDPF